jgi:hypothetical protein
MVWNPKRQPPYAQIVVYVVFINGEYIPVLAL